MDRFNGPVRFASGLEDARENRNRPCINPSNTLCGGILRISNVVGPMFTRTKRSLLTITCVRFVSKGYAYRLSNVCAGIFLFFFSFFLYRFYKKNLRGQFMISCNSWNFNIYI